MYCSFLFDSNLTTSNNIRDNVLNKKNTLEGSSYYYLTMTQKNLLYQHFLDSTFHIKYYPSLQNPDFPAKPHFVNRPNLV